MLRRAPSLPLASLAPRLAIHSTRSASQAVAHTDDGHHHDDHHHADGPDVHPTLRTIAFHPGTRTHAPPVLLSTDASFLPLSLKQHIPPLPEEPDRPVRTDPRILPLAGNRFWGVYDHLSAIDPVTTRRPIWDVGPTQSKRWPDGKVPPLWLIEYGWEKMDEDARARLSGHLKERQKEDWRDLSLVEKKASQYTVPPELTIYHTEDELGSQDDRADVYVSAACPSQSGISATGPGALELLA